MVSRARLKGEIFYATTERHACMGGAWALGLREITESLSTGEFYYKLGKFETWAACMRTIQQVPHLPEPTTYATVYAPLEKTPFDPHVVLIIAEPRAMLKLAQAELYLLGGRIESSMAGIQSVCADATALPYLSGKVNYSLGCDGSRRFSGSRTTNCYGDPAELLPVRPGTPNSHRCAGLGEVTGRKIRPPPFANGEQRKGWWPPDGGAAGGSEVLRWSNQIERSVSIYHHGNRAPGRE